VGAEGVAFLGIEGALEQRAEDRGLDLAPVGLGCAEQAVDLLAVERQGVGVSLGVLEELAVEAADLWRRGQR
jgi:hypothetical protein